MSSVMTNEFSVSVPKITSRIQGSNYLFRSDPPRFTEKFQQLEGMWERFKAHIGGLR